MDGTERVMLIRRGNELFNTKDYKNALKIYLAVEYKDGIGRIASIIEHEKKDKLSALKLYRQAGLHGNVDKIAYAMAQTVRFLIKEEKEKEALEKGENFNSGYKISGQAPALSSEEALLRAKIRLGLDPKKETTPWKPIVLSKKDLDKI